ncbi:DUF3107 domain-containing protein [Natronoglycomyces albus]|uniref:DUF3107 domain-containing protein n=1 Tax=Natronoglycomyces albus TaxID=2811108 RepID=A0A895XKV2_9ACTN|nr:DUF3107 domain-containing protein [Natronoglycomyces albus]QSB05954.1 DUF3107 domain-containing protein [Natronoglycomyces albus]
MEVKIGVQHAPRELVVESELSPEELAKQVEEAVKSETVLQLTDKKGSSVMVPTGALAYVEVSGKTTRPVGFTVDE